MHPVEEYKRTRQILFDKEGIQPQSRTITTNGPVKNVHYLEIGSGKPLILIHGGGSHSSSWINILKPLSEHFHLFVADRPGCGLTDRFTYRGVDLRSHAARFIRSFMDALNLERAAFLAQSMGGYFSICFAMQHPERVENLLLIGAPAGMNRWIPPMLRLMGTRGINSILLKTVGKPSVKNVMNICKNILVADVGKLSDDFFQHFYYGQLLPGAIDSFNTLLENALTLRGWREELYVGDKLDQLTMPVRFIWGDKDAFEKPNTGLAKAKAIRDYQFQVIENAGHAPWLDQPQACSRAVISMLKGVSVERDGANPAPPETLAPAEGN